MKASRKEAEEKPQEREIRRTSRNRLFFRPSTPGNGGAQERRQRKGQVENEAEEERENFVRAGGSSGEVGYGGRH